MRYDLRRYDELRSLPRLDGGRRSVFGPDGLVAGSERGERFLFWPMGIASAGAMRQWGRHATAFVGRRHFDDADLIERRFELDLGGTARRRRPSACASLTLNIHKGLSHFNRRMVIHELRDGLRALDADIVFLQEVQGLNQRHALRFDDLARGGAARVPRRRRAGSMSTAATRSTTTATTATRILSRFPFVSFENQDVSDHRFERRGLLHCVVEVPGWRRNLHCVCVHLSLHERGRSRQLEAISRRLEELAARDLPIIVAGDFNDWRHRAIGDPRAAPRHARGVGRAPRARGAHLPERAAAASPGPHLRARLRDRRLAGAPRQALVAAVRSPRASAPSSKRA